MHNNNLISREMENTKKGIIVCIFNLINKTKNTKYFI